jgi:formylglycine-generating enzyme required for sulfatase activity
MFYKRCAAAALLWIAAGAGALYSEERQETPFAAGKQWAVFIAIDRYAQWPALPNPVRDARELRDILVSRYLFHEIRELYNEQAGAEGVRALFADLRRSAGINDSVFVFFAGYGYRDKFTDDGFWIPSDAGQSAESGDAEGAWLSNTEMKDALAGIPAKHVFLVSDGFFSADGIAETATEGGDNGDGDGAYYLQAYRKVSRQVLTSGAVRSGPHSAAFAASLKTALREAEGPYFDAARLFERVREEVAAPSPALGVIKISGAPERTLFFQGASHQDGGSFVFFRQAGMPAVPPLRAVRTGSVMVTSEIAGTLLLDRRETGTVIGENGSAMLWNVPVGEREVSVRDPAGAVTKALRTVRVQEGRTAETLVEHPFMDTFVRIPGGVFMMGSPAAEYLRNDDEAQHQAVTRDFFMQKTAVSVAEFRRFVEETSYRTQAEAQGGYVWTGSSWEIREGAYWKSPSIAQEESHPVVLVSWHDAARYCNWRSEREGLAPAYTIRGMAVTWNEKAGGYRLPTEAEWEYAARAGAATPFSTGGTITAEQANFNGAYPYKSDAPEAYRETTVPADFFAPNAWGLYNMHGNVWEWCWDVYDAYPAGKPLAKTDPSYRVRRGGSWSYAGHYLRAAYRSYAAAASAYNSTGFRLVRSIPETTP